jgi:hypothetical protein
MDGTLNDLFTLTRTISLDDHSKTLATNFVATAAAKAVPSTPKTAQSIVTTGSPVIPTSQLTDSQQTA